MRFSRFESRDLPVRVVCILILLSTAFYGCSTSYVVTPTKEGGDYSYDDFSAEAKDREAAIVLKDKREMDGSQIEIRGDSISWIESVYQTNPKTLGRIRLDGIRHSVSVREVGRISRKNHLLGALEWLGLGVIGGAGAGAVLGGLGGTTRGDDIPGWFIGLVYGGMAGGGLGCIVGGIIGHTYNYEFPTTAQSDSLQKEK